MLLFPIQECAVQAATLISQRKLAEASELLVTIIKTLQDRKVELNDLDNSSTTMKLSDLQFLPVSRECKVVCPDWDEDFFCFPFAFFAPEGHTTDAVITDSLAMACSGTCLYMLGLCYHLSARENDKCCPDAALRHASYFYGLAGNTLRKIFARDTLGDNGAAFLLMAISTNMASCCYDLGELVAANRWLVSLNELLGACRLKEDTVTLDLHTFFMMTSTTTTGYAAAGAA
uniref:Uncharacterized protein n=1 Tax=Entomoneis paludosa TaxID=265537 RepID=A0A7S2VC41_9STRA